MSQMILRTDAPGRPGFRLNGWPWLLPALLLLLWYIAARERWMPEQILPAPSVVADTALSLLSGDLLAQWGFSLQHLALGLLLGAIAGTLLGALFGLVPAAAQRVEPLFYALAQIPTLGWIPLFMVLFGIDNGLKLAVILKTTVVPMTINTQQAVAGVPQALSEAAKVMNFSRWQRLRWLVIPASLPGWDTRYLDADRHQDLASDLGVRGLPTLLLIKPGQPASRAPAQLSVDALLDWLHRAAG